MTFRAFSALCLIAVVSGTTWADDFVPKDVIASDVNSSLPSPEFDRTTKRLVWQDRSNSLWVGNVDLVTGNLSPKNGKGTFIDNGLTPTNEILNTPRYTYGAGQSALIYNKTIGGIYTLYKAVEGPANVWTTSALAGGDNRYKAVGSPEETTDAPRIIYKRKDGLGHTFISWRSLDDPATEQTAPDSFVATGGRFFGGNAIASIMGTEFRTSRVWNVPFDSLIPEQVTFGEDNVYNAFIWFAPEYQQYLMVAIVNWQQLAIYRQIGSDWTKIYQFALPTVVPNPPMLPRIYVSSPEAFVANGKSFIAVVAAQELGRGDYKGQPKGPSEVWIAGIDPARPFFRRIDEPSQDVPRSEPEPFLLDSGPVVFYSETRPDKFLLKRAITGLPADTGYEVAHYGGGRAAGFRDSKNCSCAPYAIADEYTSAYDVPMANTQFGHPTLGPENHLYFGAIDTTDHTTHIVAVDATGGTEAYRINESAPTSKLSATDALIDMTGNYYVPANDGLSKYSSAGARLWSLATHGLARSAQFTSDGNILLFTWNGWAEIVSPAGASLYASNLTSGRVYPDNPSCLEPGGLGTDCAYIGPPALSNPPAANTPRRVYATQIRANGNSSLQAFQYLLAPSCDPGVAACLKPLWGQGVAMTGIATSPVVSADYTNNKAWLYVQDGAGNLLKFNANNGTVQWTFHLGFNSDTPPAITRDGYIMPGGTVSYDPAHNLVALVKDEGDHADWVNWPPGQTPAYIPKSQSAAGADNRFAVVAADPGTQELQLLVVDPSGIVSATPWGEGDLPTDLKGLTLREDGWVFVQTSGTNAVKAFAPVPSP
jgi:hypothetical protein